MTTARNIFLVPALAAATLAIMTGQAVAAKSMVAKNCVKCHQAETDTLRGFMKAGSQTDSGFAVQVDKDTWDVSYDASTKMAKNLSNAKEIGDGRIIMVKIKEEGGKNVATELSYKTPEAYSDPARVIEAAELTALLKKDPKKANYLVLDVRGVSYYEEGHLPGAVVIPNYRFAKYKDRLPKDKNTQIITYCNGYTCSMSPNFYRVLTEGYGYKNVRMFSSGFPAWRTSGEPVHTEPEFVKYIMDSGQKDSFVLVDLRSPDKAKAEHLPGAVNLPASDMKAVWEALPSDKKARIILYSDNMAEAEKAMRALRVNAYDVVSVLAGGVKGWKAKGYPMAANSLAAEVKYKKQLIPGQISVEEFKAIAKDIPADKVVVDVRRPDERAKRGKIAGTISIPVDTLDARWVELPKDKEIIVHCQDGPRASVAFDVLKEHGVKARYLFGGFKWNKDGSYEVQGK